VKLITHRIYLSILAVTAGMFCSCENSVEEINKVQISESYPEETTIDVELTYSDSGKVRAILKAPLLERYLTTRQFTELRKGVDIEFFNSEGVSETHLTANYARYYQRQGRMEAQNEVVVVNSQGDKLNTEHLVWDEKTRKIYSDAFVKIQTAKEIIYGDGLEADEDFTNFEIKEPKGILQLEDEDVQ